MLRTRNADLHEYMDESALSREELRRVLRDLRHINALLGWRRLAVRRVRRLVHARGLSSFALLDVASGAADIPLAIARWAARAGVPARIVATDFLDTIVAVAHEQAATMPHIQIERADALALPYAAGSFDIGMCTLALHHFAPDDAVLLLSNLGRVARDVLVFDLVRSSWAFMGAILLTRLGLMDRVTRHDGPVSVRRAYTAAELRELAERAGLHDIRVTTTIPFRLTLAARGPDVPQSPA
jgi:2-polyprenyl-3-methyl-5-hydroxy-6-metoxy-1,4-benzoquinol methylase